MSLLVNIEITVVSYHADGKIVVCVICDAVTITSASHQAPGFIVPREQETLIGAASLALNQNLDLNLRVRPSCVNPVQTIVVVNKIAVTELYLITSIDRKSFVWNTALADPGGGVLRTRPLSVHFLSFLCSFRQKPCQIIGFHFKIRGLAPPSGKSWIRHCTMI